MSVFSIDLSEMETLSYDPLQEGSCGFCGEWTKGTWTYSLHGTEDEIDGEINACRECAHDYLLSEGV